MNKEIALGFDLPWLPTVGLILFFTIFIFMLIWVFRKDSKLFYQKAGELPMEDGQQFAHKGLSNE